MKLKNILAILLFFFISLNLYSQEVSKYSVFKHTTYGYFEIDTVTATIVNSENEYKVHGVASDTAFDKVDSNGIRAVKTETSFGTSHDVKITFEFTHDGEDYYSGGKVIIEDLRSGEILRKYDFNTRFYLYTKAVANGTRTVNATYYQGDRNRPHDKMRMISGGGYPITTFHFLEKVGDKWLSHSYDCILMKQ